MPHHDNASENRTFPSHSLATDDVETRAPNPRQRFPSPELLMADEGLSDTEKYALMQEWDLDLDNRLKAEEEGMSASDPIRGQQEAKLADEASRVKNFLTELAIRLGND